MIGKGAESVISHFYSTESISNGSLLISFLHVPSKNPKP